MADDMPFEDEEPPEPTLLVDVDGYAGPLDLLLDLARRQKVDLARISVLALADQYLRFIEQARRLHLELAADYLVMAAWLAYLKSRLLLPDRRKEDEPSAEDMADALAFRLQRLEAIRLAARRLSERDRLGRDVFGRGMPQSLTVTRKPCWEVGLYDLLAAYARERQKRALSHLRLAPRQVWTLAEAREALARLTGAAVDWTVLDDYLLQCAGAGAPPASVRASGFAAALEMVREGVLDIQQDRAFAPIWIKNRLAGAATPA